MTWRDVLARRARRYARALQAASLSSLLGLSAHAWATTPRPAVLTGAQAVRVALTVPDPAADTPALQEALRTEIAGCAGGRVVELWLTIELAPKGRQRARLQAALRVLVDGSDLGARTLYGANLKPLIDAAALLTCVAVSRRPLAPDRKPSTPSASRGRATPEATTPDSPAAGSAASLAPAALPTAVTASSAPIARGSDGNSPWPRALGIGLGVENGSAPGPALCLELSHRPRDAGNRPAALMGPRIAVVYGLVAAFAPEASLPGGDPVASQRIGLRLAGQLRLGPVRVAAGVHAAALALSDRGSRRWAPWLAVELEANVTLLRRAQGALHLVAGAAAPLRAIAIHAVGGSDPRWQSASVAPHLTLRWLMPIGG